MRSTLLAWLLLSLCVTYDWPLQSMCYLLLTSVICVLHTPKPYNIYIAIPWPLHSVHYLLVTSVLCMLLTSDFCVLLTPDLCTLCITYSCSLFSVCYLLLTFVLCMLFTPGPFTHFWPISATAEVLFNHSGLDPSHCYCNLATPTIFCRAMPALHLNAQDILSIRHTELTSKWLQEWPKTLKVKHLLTVTHIESMWRRSVTTKQMILCSSGLETSENLPRGASFSIVASWVAMTIVMPLF